MTNYSEESRGTENQLPGIETIADTFPIGFKDGSTPCVILCDFDGTISLRDVTDLLLQKFGMSGFEDIESEWEAGRIGSLDCMSRQIALLDMSRAELDACLDIISIDPSFRAFVDLARARQIEVHVISDGLDYAIERILTREGLRLPIFANHLRQTEPRRWRLEFPNARSSCRQASGNCKCANLEARQQRGEKVIFVGDGSSDFCASGVADSVLAKSRLIGHCSHHGIKHVAISDFRDALDALPDIIDTLAAD